MIADPGQTYLLDIIVKAEENIYTMIPAGGTYRDIILNDEDLKKLSRDKQGSNV